MTLRCASGTQPCLPVSTKGRSMTPRLIGLCFALALLGQANLALAADPDSASGSHAPEPLKEADLQHAVQEALQRMKDMRIETLDSASNLYDFRRVLVTETLKAASVPQVVSVGQPTSFADVPGVHPLTNQDYFAAVSRDVQDTVLDSQPDRVIGPGGSERIGALFPSCVAVGDLSADATFQCCCSGVLVAPRVVITAAHCVLPPSHSQSPCSTATHVCPAQDVRTGSPATVRIERVMVHPGYLCEGFPDLAVLILEAELTQVQPAVFATHAEIAGAGAVVVCGYGSNSMFGVGGNGVRRGADIRITSHDCSCEPNSIRHAEHGCHCGHELVAKSSIPPGLKGNADTCFGDSGGPAFVYAIRGESPRPYLAAITSRALLVKDDVYCGWGGIYVRADKFEQWINEQVQAHLRANP